MTQTSFPVKRRKIRKGLGSSHILGDSFPKTNPYNRSNFRHASLSDSLHDQIYKERYLNAKSNY